MKILNEQNFETELEEKLAIVEFSKEGCFPCENQHKILNQIRKKLKNDSIEIAETFDKNLKKRYGIKATPTLIFFFRKKELFRCEGVRKLKEIKQILDDSIIKIKNIKTSQN